MEESERYFAKRKPIKCPKCGSKKVARILWGKPAFSPELEKELEEQKIVLGGCCCSLHAPSWCCAECNTPIYRESLRDEVIEEEDW